MAINRWEGDSHLYSQSQALLAETPEAELQALKSLPNRGQSRVMIPVQMIKHIPAVGEIRHWNLHKAAES
ncbi:hypothetical protein [Microcystis aeruginosa]|jgi:hypothetical protein|uniref:hypothetical protein n=1 Tax=Microcystis aeruginosa TaxID=1126 RepID=UPI001E3414C9|nr:hypothetical protein [Microcystis aeruginosa]MDB9423117.1 hypothetical protein [Microcystis aeruginosa CS-563/04]